MKQLALLALCLLSGAAAQPGRLSYVEPDARPGIVARGDPRRLPTGFVEVVHDGRLEACRRKGWERCEPYEWSIPFAPESAALAVERGLSEAWNRYDARTYWRIQTELGGQVAKLVNCTLGLTNLDPYLGVWDWQLFKNMPSSDFCDDLNPDLFLYIPTFCPLMDALTFWDRVAEAYRRGYAHAVTRYQPDYWADVGEVIAKNIPLALWWDGVYPVGPGQESGLVLQPVASTPKPGQYLDLALEAEGRDARGFPYILARYPFLNLLGGVVTSRLAETVRRLPAELDEAGRPGLPHLEPLKANLSRREGVFSRPNQWADLLNGPQPRGESGAATPYEYAGVGHAVALGVRSSFVAELSPRVPVFWRVCFTVSLPPVPVPVPTPMPVVHAAPRADTLWLSVPEGYPILGTKGVPRW